jgi:hypothetical protein
MINRNEALSFLTTFREHMREAGGFLQIHASKLDGEKAFPRTGLQVLEEGQDDLVRALNWADERSAEGRNIYVTLNPMMTRDIRGKELVTGYRAVLADIDTYKAGVSQEEALDALANFPNVEPTFVINSGRGVQAIYFVDTVADYKTWERMNLGVYHAFKHLGGDAAVDTDSSRIFKLPGYPAKAGDGATRPTSIMLATGEVWFPEIMTASFPVPKKAETGDALISIIGDDELSAIEKWCRKPTTISHGGRDAHIASLTAHYAGKKNMSFDEALATAMALCRAYVEDFERDFSEDDVKDKLTSAFTKFRSKDRSAWDVVEKIATPEQIEEEGDNLIFRGCEIDKRQDAPVFFLDGLANGDIGMIASVTNVGKTTLALNIGVSLSVQRPYFDLIPADTLRHPRRVLYIDKENGKHRTLNSLRKMKGGYYEDYDNDVVDPMRPGQPGIKKYDFEVILDDVERTLFNENFFYTTEAKLFRAPLDLSKPEHIKVIERQVKKLGIDLVIVDTMATAFALKNENDNAEVHRKMLDPLREFTTSTGKAVLMLHHIGKQGGQEREQQTGVHAPRGASAITGNCNMVWNLTCEGNDRTIVNLECAKSKGEEFAPKIMYRNPATQWFNPTPTATQLERREVEKRAKIYSLASQIKKRVFLTADIKEWFEGGKNKPTDIVQPLVEEKYLTRNDRAGRTARTTEFTVTDKYILEFGDPEEREENNDSND